MRHSPRLARLCSPTSALGRSPSMALIAVAVVAVIGCAKAKTSAAPGLPADQAAPIGPQECAACGMVVREQPAPRGQVVHRDGTRGFFCSLGDMIQYQQAPSPHGKITHVYVEVMTAGVDPDQHSMAPHTWLPADRARYLLGVKRRGIMGPPVLSFANAGDAAKARARIARAPLHKGIELQSLDWNTLPKAVLQAAQQPNAH